MIIAFNTISFRNNRSDGLEFFYQALIKIAEEQPDHTFIFIFDKIVSQSFSENIIPITVSPKSVNALLWQYWYNYKISGVLKKYKVHIFLSFDAISLRTKINQFLVIPDLEFLHQSQIPNRKEFNFLKRNTPKYINKAKRIITFYQCCKDEIINVYKIKPEKISLCHIAAEDVFIPINFSERESIKEKYADGNEYFMFSGIDHPTNNLYNLLKAFSFFKKRQKSNMQLIIALSGNRSEDLTEKLRLFKFKSEVKLINNIPEEELARIIASAYAFVYSTVSNSLATALLQALKAEVPIVTSDFPVLHELAGTGALYCDPNNINDIAEKMMVLFKDEKLRRELIEKGKAQSNNYNKESATGFLWKTINEAVN